ncbi:MAG: SPOR domain-containing protein [Acidobacteriota bacterium]
MSDLEDTSYYEIALTNRQVLVAFVILLVCMLTSFLSGVWVGRLGDGTGVPDPALAMQRGDALAQSVEPGGELANNPAAAEESDEDKKLEPLSFFQEGEEEEPEASDAESTVESEGPAQSSRGSAREASPPAQERQAAPPPRSQQPVLEEQNPTPPPARAAPRRQQDSPPPAEGTNSAAQNRPSSAQPDGSSGVGSSSRPGGSSGVVPESSSPANPAVPRTSARRVSEASGDLFIQVFSTRDEVQARKVLQRLQDQGYNAFLSPVEVEAQTMYRVRLGPYTDRADAETAAGDVRRNFRLDTWITAG